MPVLFVGHGSPMNAIEENEFVLGWRGAAKMIPPPAAILCISAHWETRGTYVTAMENPQTIHDFGGFPRVLYEQQYPAPGSPELARDVMNLIGKTDVGLDNQWGLDHGTWSVLKHMYPDADIPVVQMSLDRYQSSEYHYDLARELAPLRRKGVLIIGSGNMVHNLGMVAWDRLIAGEFAFDWAQEAHDKMISFIKNDNHRPLVDYNSQGRSFSLSVPTPEHFLPLLYALALKEEGDKISIFNDKIIGGSIAMTALKIENVL